MTSKKTEEWIADQAIMLVGAASVLVNERQWKMLEKRIADALREATKRGQ